MKYATIKLNDIVDGEGVCVSLWVQGCPHRCEGCHNPETWNFDSGKEFTETTKEYIINSIFKNDIQRNFSVLGGEPLCEENALEVSKLIVDIRTRFNNIKIFVWTGYTLQELQEINSSAINMILSNIDYLIDGRFELDKRDLTLKLRGSSNQHIYKRINNDLVLIE